MIIIMSISNRYLHYSYYVNMDASTSASGNLTAFDDKMGDCRTESLAISWIVLAMEESRSTSG